jgi:hypothetical protein
LPNQRAAVRERLKEIIEADDALILDDCTEAFVRFIPKALDLPYFNGGNGWTSTKRLLLFEFRITPKSVVLFIIMGPGDPQRRKHIHEFALADKAFQVEQKFYDKYQSLYKKPFVDELDGGIDQEQLIHTIESKWQEFVENDLPRIEQKFLAHQWPEDPGAVPITPRIRVAE